MNNKISIGIASDHAGFDYKSNLVPLLEKQGYEITDYGCFSTESVDYPDFAHSLVKSMEEEKNRFGILFCGSGNGINMTANKYKFIRSALCWNSEIAQLARQHNDANICAMPARYISFETVVEIVSIFLKTDFEGGRHQLRVNKICCQ